MVSDCGYHIYRLIKGLSELDTSLALAALCPGVRNIRLISFRLRPEPGDQIVQLDYPPGAPAGRARHSDFLCGLRIRTASDADYAAVGVLRCALQQCARGDAVLVFRFAALLRGCPR